MQKIALPLLALTIFAAFIAAPAAASHCYAPEQVRAERLLRLHSELMVITVTCRQSSEGRDLVSAYTGFTRKNIAALREAERALIAYYADAYGGRGTDRFDTLRTKLANEYGQQSADESAPTFCANRRDKVIAMFDAPPADVAEESLHTYASARTYAPSCGDDIKVAQATSRKKK